MMEGWKEYKLNELGKVNRGKSRCRPRNEPSLYGGEYPFIQTGDIKAANFYIKEFSQTYNEKGLKQSKLWKKGTLCITIAANIAETAILDIDACFPDSIIGFVADATKADVRFIKYHFDLLKLHLQSISLGTTQDNLSQEKLLKFTFTVPEDVKKQTQIADILSSYDEKIEINYKKIKQIEETARELYKEWFVRMRFPGYKKTSFIKGIPEGWSLKSLFEVADVLYGFPFQSELFNENCNGLPIIRIRDLVEGKTDTYTPEIPSEKYCAKDGDILIGMDGDFHFCKWAGGIAWINQRNVRLQPKQNTDISSYFLYHVTKPQIEFLNEIIVGTTVAHLSANDLKKMKLLIPSEQLLKEFKRISDPLYQMEIILKKENEQLRQIRDRLLPRLISGKMKLKEPSTDLAPIGKTELKMEASF
jgi:type I restriction enzyme, S subunit